MKWKPISEADLWNKINVGAARLISSDQNFWVLVRVAPKKWKEKRFGRVGGGFWVVGIAGHRVIWYNDIEEGFNISKWLKYGEIAEYFANQDDLDHSVRRLFELVRFGDGS